MISFKISAPGKIILFGEHAVMYGKTALAASLNLRTNLTFQEIEEVNDVIKLNLHDMNLKLSIPISLIVSYINIYKTYCLENNRDSFSNEIHRLSSELGYSNQSLQKLCLEALFYLFIYVVEKEGINVKPAEISLSTELTIGAGLGSSASFSVCLSACFFHWSRLQKNIRKTLDASDLEIITNYAFECEKILHGTPSGIDNSICTYGSILEFRKCDGVTLIPNAMKLKILLVDTKTQRSTKAMIDKTAKLKLMFPTVFDCIMDAIDNVAKEALKILTEDNTNQTDNDSEENEKYNQLKTLIDINQHFLAALQVSHPLLDKICVEAQNYEFGAKLTGAGGGGYAFILLPHNTQPEIISSISQKLIAYGCGVMSTSLGGSGVIIDE